MYRNAEQGRVSPTVNTSRVKLDRFTVGADSTCRTDKRKAILD